MMDSNHPKNDSMQSQELTLDQLFHILADQHRRYILTYLQNACDRSVDQNELRDAIIAQELSSEPSEEYRDQVEVKLHHAHLPRLAEADLIETDDQKRAIRYVGHPLLEQYLTRGR